MNVFGLGTSSLFAAGLSILVALTFIAGFIKVAFNKRDLKKKVKLANLEAANKQTDLEKLVGNREPDEGDLFGVRAIQAGFFGGVSQSCPNSPSSSRSSSLCSLGINSKEANFSKSSPLHLELPKPSRNTSQTSRSTKTSSQNSTSMVDSTTSQGHPANNITFGLHFNNNNSLIPNKPSYQPTSEEDKEHGKSFSDTLITPELVHKSMHASHASSEERSSSLQESCPKDKNTNRCLFPSTYYRSQSSGLSHSNLSEDSKTSNQGNGFAEANVPLANLPRQISPPAIIRDSVVCKQKVSIHLPVKSRRLISNDKRLHGDVISSICSMRTSITEPIMDQSHTVDCSDTMTTSNTANATSTNEDAQLRDSSSSSRVLQSQIASQGYTLMNTNQPESVRSQQCEIDGLRDSTFNESKVRIYSTSSSQSSSSEYDKSYRLTSAEIAPFALQDFELPAEDDFCLPGSDPRVSRCSISELYDTYYRQPNLYQSGTHIEKEFDFDLRGTSRTLT